MSVESRLRRLEEWVRGVRVHWRTRGSEEVECFPKELLSLEGNESLRAKVLDADPTSVEDSPLLSWVRAFEMSKPDIDETDRTENNGH
jgi:hypothetical protein